MYGKSRVNGAFLKYTWFENHVKACIPNTISDYFNAQSRPLIFLIQNGRELELPIVEWCPSSIFLGRNPFCVGTWGCLWLTSHWIPQFVLEKNLICLIAFRIWCYFVIYFLKAYTFCNIIWNVRIEMTIACAVVLFDLLWLGSAAFYIIFILYYIFLCN
jgi:hypothetical protein